MKHLGWLDIAVAIGAVLLSLWQLLLVDSSLIGFVIFWAIPPFLAVVIKVVGGGANWNSQWASAYVMMMAASQSITSTPAILPQFVALHPAATEFAQKWNQLDIVPRRVISVNMTLTGAFIFAWLGYVFGWLPLVRSPHAERLARPICVLALITLWLLPGLGLLGMIIDSVRQ